MRLEENFWYVCMGLTGLLVYIRCVEITFAQQFATVIFIRPISTELHIRELTWTAIG